MVWHAMPDITPSIWRGLEYVIYRKYRIIYACGKFTQPFGTYLFIAKYISFLSNERMAIAQEQQPKKQEEKRKHIHLT